MSQKIISLIATMAFVLSSSLIAEEKKANVGSEEQAKMHEQMAKAHQEVADCLKSGKTMNDCSEPLQKMRAECPHCKGDMDASCPMMEKQVKTKKTKKTKTTS